MRKPKQKFKPDLTLDSNSNPASDVSFDQNPKQVGSSDLIQLKHSDIKTIKLELLEKQNHQCPICHRELSEDEFVLDHQHRLNKHQTPGENGAGLVRGAICNGDNLVEGKLSNALRRYRGITDVNDKIEFLESLIEYYKNYLTNYIHPTEKPQEPKVSKKNYNKLKKLYTESGSKKKFPEYPKSGKLTKSLNELFEKFNISPFNSSQHVQLFD